MGIRGLCSPDISCQAISIAVRFERAADTLLSYVSVAASLAPMTVPTVDDIDRITRIDNPIIRNLQITQCYFEISQSITTLTSHSANWCTFATWASKQAGQTIRQEDLVRAFVERFYGSAKISAALDEIVVKLASIGPLLEVQDPRKVIFRALIPARPLPGPVPPLPGGTRNFSRRSAASSLVFLRCFKQTATSSARR